jgi:hypothetical protein
MEHKTKISKIEGMIMMLAMRLHHYPPIDRGLVVLSLSPGLSFIPSLIGFGKARPTEFPHLTRVLTIYLSDSIV